MSSRERDSVEWNKDEQKVVEKQYDNGEKIGLEIMWYDNGIKAFETQYKNGGKHGLDVSWDKNGKKVTRIDTKKAHDP